MDYMAEEVKKALADLETDLGKRFEKIDDLDEQVTGIKHDMTELFQKGTKSPAPASHKSGGSIREALTKSPGLERMRKENSKNSDPIDLGLSIKALTSLQGSGGSPAEGIDVLPEREGGLYGYAMRPLSLLDVLPIRPISSNALTFTRMVNFVNAAAGQGAEGTEKAEQTITPTLITAPVETIAVWHDASKQVLDDEPGLEATIGMLLSHGATEKAERQIVNGAGGSFEMSGLITDGTTFVPTVAPMADRIGQCQATMANAGYQPSLVMLNPVDWFTIRSERAVTGDEQYIGPGWAAPAAPSIYGVQAVASAAVPQGTAIVVDTRFVNLLDRQQTTVELSRETGNNFKQNIVTVLAELRMGLAIYDTAAVQVINLTGTV
ncbi:phage major capsid protein [Marinobacter sp. DUT-1]|uniref:phage major capsid protein n=1 Tax=Marinobacter sp. DUT-1 TaxID=3412037 RepID=UPI003D1799B3